MSGDFPGESRGYGPFQQDPEATTQMTPGAGRPAPQDPPPASPSIQDSNDDDPDRTTITPPNEPTAVIPVQPQVPPGGPAPTSAAPSGAWAGDAASTSAAPGGVMPGDPAQGGGVQGGVAPGGAAPSDPAQGGGVPGGVAPGGAAPSDPAQGGGVPGGVVPTSGASPGAVPGGGMPGGEVPGSAAPGSAAPGHVTPTTGAPGEATGPWSGAPTTGQPYSGPPQTSTPSYGPFHNNPTSGAPGWPTSGAPTSYPTSGAPAGEVDAFGLPVSGGGQYSFAPTSGGAETGAETGAATTDDDRFGFDAPISRGPRIEPSPPPQRGKLLLGLVAGLVVGLLVFGVGGFFTGRLTADEAQPQPTEPTEQPQQQPSLGVYEQSQVRINEPKLTGGVSVLTPGWLPYLSSCDRSGFPGGPSLNKGEVTRVRCRLDGMSVIFVKYTTIAERDKARTKILSQNVDARTLTPGAAQAGEKAAPSGRTSGAYIEFAYQIDENRQKQTVAGIWWDDTDTAAAAYMLAFWKNGVGESWEPIRDVWARYA